MAKKTNNVKKGRLSNDDFNIFKENIHLSDQELADKLNRNVNFMENTRKRVYPNKKTGKWNKADIEILKANSSEMTIEELARLLNRTEKAIKSKLKSLETKPSKQTSDNPYIQESLDTMEEEIFPGDCCGENCCEHEAKVEEAKPSFWMRVYNFLKVW